MSLTARSIYGSRSEVSYDGSPYTPRICSCVFGGKNDEQLAANARIIAAAPAMLELVESIENDDGKIPQWLWDRIQAVVKKAKGEL